MWCFTYWKLSMCKVVLLQFVLEWTLAVSILQSYFSRAWVILSHQLKSALTQLWILPLVAENEALSQYTKRQTRTPYLSSNYSTERCMQRLTQSSVKQAPYNDQDMYEKRQLVSPENWHPLSIKIPTKLAPTSLLSFPLTCLKPEQNYFPFG